MNDNSFLRQTENKVFTYIEDNHLVHPGDSLVLGVSGGVDSVCLLLILVKYRETVPFDMTVVHINHGIRAEAGEDAAFTERLCAELGIPFRLFCTDIRQMAAEEKCSEEDAGRRFRYQCFRKVCAEIKADSIAVAHNANDKAETVLLHLFRGAGLRGLRGIEAKRDDIIRPLLVLSREEIERYMAERGYDHREDCTNGEDAYARNRVRHHILPAAEKMVSENVVEHLCSTADAAAETEQFLKKLTKQAAETCVREECIDVKAFLEQPEILQKRILLDLCESLSPTGKDISSVHVNSVLDLFRRDGNRTVCLPFDIRFRRSYDKVFFADRDREAEDPACRVRLTYFAADGSSFPQKTYTKWFDCDKIIEPVEVRFRRQGDYFTVSDGNGGMRHKSLKEYMINEKIPAEERDFIPVVASGSHILWLVGYRISEYFKTDSNTKNILQAEYEGVSEDCPQNYERKE